jgi:hypothetical protein
VEGGVELYFSSFFKTDALEPDFHGFGDLLKTENPAKKCFQELARS